MGMAQGNVKQLLVENILHLAKENERYINLRDTAKTQLKKDYYNKKIKKGSEKAERLLLGLQKISPSTASAPTPEPPIAIEETPTND